MLGSVLCEPPYIHCKPVRISLTTQQARQLRLRAQHLDSKALVGVAELVRDLGAVQAQDGAAEVLAVRVRTEGLTDGDVERA